ncbi:histidine kinase [Neomoorella humiferrea]|uniref:histidine kinase n=1 Tax=Neomoorella humiferrea TaxID=676965 RepID=A0A2T0AJZ4_9FIRM|nr:histidine kinase [Moorella humiferrea]PRR68732.1 Sensor histidine kinase YehU [Moorella humiferrea]
MPYRYYLLFLALTLAETLVSRLLFHVPTLPALLALAGINALGGGLLKVLQGPPCSLTQSPVEQEEENDATEGIFASTLQIAHETLPVLRAGLNEVTAAKTAEIIQNITEVPAIAITDRENVLTFLGVGCDQHRAGDRILTEATKEVIATGKLKVVHTPQGLCCPRYNMGCNCPLKAAVIVPLKCREEIVGALKLYQTREGVFPPQIIRLAIGLADLLSLQIELAELDRQRQLLTEARLEALNAQINPHFFFNTLNTIISFSRTDPERARRLLIRLASLFRRTLNRRGSLTTLREELECVRTYLVLEKARFGNKFRYFQDVPINLLDYHIPVLSLQPLVENAINHGLLPKEGPGMIKISGRLSENELHLTVQDDGIGIPAEKIPLVLQPGYGSGNGVGLSNVNLRFQNLYGPEYGLRVESGVQGTTVYLRVPVLRPAIVKDATAKELLLNEA